MALVAFRILNTAYLLASLSELDRQNPVYLCKRLEDVWVTGPCDACFVPGSLLVFLWFFFFPQASYPV